MNWVEKIEGAHLNTLFDLCSKEWWSKDRTQAQLQKMVENSDIVIGCCDDNNQLIGFARVLTDFTFKAWVFDVIVAQNCRHKKLGSAIVNRILEHEKLASVPSFELYCPDEMVPFYNQFGFKRSATNMLFFKR